MNLKKARKSREITEFGDFQTPIELALAVAHLIMKLGIAPKSVLEPSCGKGAFVEAALRTFGSATRIVGVDINQSHLDIARQLQLIDPRVEIGSADFFTIDWRTLLNKFAEPLLILGNPPWITSSQLGSLASKNLPEKSNFHGRSGIEAITGKSNFDISEWMLLRYLDCLENRDGAFAVLCKITVARKVLLNAWKRNYTIKLAQMHKIDALANFGAAVDACLFLIQTTSASQSDKVCDVYGDLTSQRLEARISLRDGFLVSDDASYFARRNLVGPERCYVWRSGIKHDCSKVMELRVADNGYVNGFGERVFLEDDFLFPMLKSSDVGNHRLTPRSKMIVTQKYVGEDTGKIQRTAPLTWSYLTRHADLLNRRGSSIYRKKPPFSIFGVGPYSFMPWKIAISGLYKSLRFVKVGPSLEKPTVFDDTITFLPCNSEDEADFLLEALSSQPATDFLKSMIWWDEKRPITSELLKRLDLRKLAAEIGRVAEFDLLQMRGSEPLFASNRKSAA